jgi:hypothetical protein
MGPGKNGGETVRKKTAISAKPASTRTASPAKAKGASGPGAQCQAGKPVCAESIRLCAYQKWEAAGKPDGDGTRFWVEAEQELSLSE